MTDVTITREDGGPDQVPGESLHFLSPEGHAIEVRYGLTQGTRLRGVFVFDEEDLWARRRIFATSWGGRLVSLCPTDHLLYLAYHAGVGIGSPGVVASFTPAIAEGAFRWDAADQQWVLNLATSTFAAGGTFSYSIGLDDGTAIPVQFGLK